MPTKAELEKENASLKGQLTKAKNALAKAKVAEAEEASDALSAAAKALTDSIMHRGLDTQVGQKQLRLVVEALGEDYHAGR